MMWQQTQCFCLILSRIITGSFSDSWDMKVSPVVSVPRGEDAVLSCSFTHPKQQDFSGKITVKWLARETSAFPFFRCSVQNNSMERFSDCSVSGLKYSLAGDPRWGELSLLIRRVHLTDNGTYFCQVELDNGWWNNLQKETQLYVTAKPQILSLSVVETSPGSDSSTRRLQCEAEGHPLPTITWLSASNSPIGDQVQTSNVSPYRLISSVPYLEEDVFTCRVESRLGGAEWRYPPSNTLIITLTVCGLIALLLLLSTGFICYTRNKARVKSSPGCENTDTEENHQQGSDSPAEGDVELQLVYSAVTVTSSASSQHATFRSSTKHQEEPGVFYCDRSAASKSCASQTAPL
ncbi:sialic acid binding Ig-like lectin 15, like isoform X2 [Siniperca chuatsi]|uniref:sialic acid binding Ig-like lectin 15, like isoform X2 n=1 Tax=Siniperca chuatsi TaxID=119488 RepID=UPI001CE1EC31|nr:sialic acid binding Ig-like lectin 15, like isoform X2 [Siniperca chuatsi]